MNDARITPADIAQRIEASTRAGDERAGKFWKSEIGDKPLRAIKHSDVLTALAKHPLQHTLA